VNKITNSSNSENDLDRISNGWLFVKFYGSYYSPYPAIPSQQTLQPASLIPSFQATQTPKTPLPLAKSFKQRRPTPYKPQFLTDPPRSEVFLLNWSANLLDSEILPPMPHPFLASFGYISMFRVTIEHDVG